MSIIDTIVFLIFTGGVVLLGCSFFSKKRTSDEFTSLKFPTQINR